MSYILLIYLILAVVIIGANIRSKKTIWLFFLFSGFLISNVGLAFYSEIISFSNHTENPLFKEISSYLWIINYYLNLNLASMYRIMNIGTVFYTVGALGIALVLVPDHLYKKKINIILISSVTFLLLYEPYFLKLVFSDSGTPYSGDSTGLRFSEFLPVWNIIGNIVIKISIITSIVLMVLNYRKSVKVLKPKLFLTLLGIIPTHIFFIILFYWFPNHNVQYRRYALLDSISLPYNEYFYGFLFILMGISISLLTFTVFRYNILQMNVRRNMVRFRERVNTANSGLKVFSHSIKNQFIAIKLLASQMEDENRDFAGRIEKICISSIDQLSSLSKDMNPEKLIYEPVKISEIFLLVKDEFLGQFRKLKIFINSEDFFLLIDRKHFAEILRNIMINSIEAFNDDTRELEIKIKSLIYHDYCIIDIIDNGPGVDDTDLKLIFDPFFSTKPTVSNWGLGLSYCLHVVEAFGGSIEVENNADRGLCTRIFIPLAGATF